MTVSELIAAINDQMPGVEVYGWIELRAEREGAPIADGHPGSMLALDSQLLERAPNEALVARICAQDLQADLERDEAKRVVCDG